MRNMVGAIIAVMLVLPTSIQAQHQDPEAVLVALVALEGLQDYGVIPAEAEALRAILIDR